MTRGEICKHNAWQALISIDQAIHACGGAIWAVLACLLPVLPTGQAWADETFSCRAWRWQGWRAALALPPHRRAVFLGSQHGYGPKALRARVPF